MQRFSVAGECLFRYVDDLLSLVVLLGLLPAIGAEQGLFIANYIYAFPISMICGAVPIFILLEFCFLPGKVVAVVGDAVLGVD